MTERLPLILASASPNRKRLLLEAGVEFTTLPPDEHAEDDKRPHESSEEYVARLAVQKAKNVADKVERGMIIGADTIVLCGNNIPDCEILEKPVDRDDARRMLRLLRGQIHYVLSGLCLIAKDASLEIIHQGTALTRLFMQPITDDQLESYLDTEIWQGKSGAFGYQDCKGWIEILEGSETNVIGLPIDLLRGLEQAAGRGILHH